MRANLALGLNQGMLMPHPRPNLAWLSELATNIGVASRGLATNAMSASPMWAANAATVSPAPDAADGKCHLTVANLRTMPHRSHEWPATLAQLRLAFADSAFAVHDPVPPAFGDEGAANHMRLAAAHDAAGLEIFIYGVSGGAFPARQHVEASQAIVRRHQLAPERTILAEQSEAAIAAGAFHNDVVAVANGPVLFAHEHAFADRAAIIDQCHAIVPGFELVEVADADVPLADAITSYLFNAQLVSPPDGETTLIVPVEARETPSVWRWIERHIAGNGPIRRVNVVDVRESMANGGGPACLRLRVVADPATVDPRFIIDNRKLDALTALVSQYWPSEIHSDDLTAPALLADIASARAALLTSLDLGQLV
jgi:succinylarginine dihydrolase